MQYRCAARSIGVILTLTAAACHRSAPPPAHPAPPRAHATAVRTLEGITEYRLDNGLQVLLFPDATRSTVTVNMTYFVGSRQEGYGETGMAHLLEHMTFKDVGDYGDLLAALDARGADSNATTDYDRTNYFETLEASDDNLGFAIDAEAARMRHARLDPDDLATELDVVLGEMETNENDPAQVLIARVMSTMYLWHAYGRAVVGDRADVEHVPIARLRDFYDRWYQPDDAMLVVAGKIDPAATLAKIETSFGTIARPTRKLPETYTIEPVQDGERSVALRRTGTVPLVDVAYHTVAGSDPDFPAVEAALDIATREPTGRLYKPLVAAQLASSIGGFSVPLREPGLVMFEAEVPDASHLADVEGSMIATVEGLGKTPISDDELDRWRAETLRDLDLSMADSEHLALELSEWAAMGDWRLVFAYRDRVKALTAADVQRVAATWFKASNRTVGEFVPTARPDRTPLPERPDVAPVVANVHTRVVELGESFVATLDHLIARTKFAHLGGGIDAAFLPKKTRGGTVRLTLTLRYGDLDSLTGKDGLGAAVAAMVERGTIDHSYAQLEDEQAKLRADIDITGDDGWVTVQIETVRDSLPKALDLALEMLMHPSFPADQLDVVRGQELAALSEHEGDPTAQAFSALTRAIEPYPDDDPRAVMTDPQAIAQWKRLTVDELAAFHREFWGTGKGELVVIGDFDPDAISKQVEHGLAGWTSKHPWQKLGGKHFDVAASEQRIDLPDKEQAIVAVGRGLVLGDFDDDYPAADIAAYALAGSSNGRLWKRLREQDGYSYDVTAWIDASPTEQVGGFGAYATMAPADVPAAKAALLEELARFAKDGIGADELAATKKAWLDADAAALADDATLASTLEELLYEGRDLGWLKEQRAAVAKLTVADVSAAARAYCGADGLVVIEAGDLAETKGTAASHAADKARKAKKSKKAKAAAKSKK